VTLSGAAPSGGAVVTLSSSNTNVATVPVSVTISAGATGASFTVATSLVSASTSVDVSGNYNSVTKTATLIVTAPLPSGSVLYVNPSGSDSNPGTFEQPFRTIQRAADLVNPGDTVMVQDGVYTDSDGDRVVVKLRRGGTSTARITFLSEHRWGARIDGQNNTSRTGFEFSTGANFVRLEGFEITGIGNTVPTDGASGVLIYNGGSDCEIVGNHIHDCGRACTDTANGENAIFVGSQNRVLIEGNLIHDVGRFAPGEQGCNPSSTNYQNHDHGLYINQANDVTVRNNIFYNCKRGWCIQIYPGPSDRIKIDNNTFAFENPYRDGHIIVGADGADNEIKNNIFYDPLNAAIRLYSGTQTNMVIANNMIYGGGVYSGTATAVVIFIINWPNTDPLLVSPLTYDFHLRAVSPAIDVGLSIFTVIYDFDGVIRPQGAGYNLGACERLP
jgi:hypothetical protein